VERYGATCESTGAMKGKSPGAPGRHGESMRATGLRGSSRGLLGRGGAVVEAVERFSAPICRGGSQTRINGGAGAF
jgi:hypothetical protein